MTTLKALRELKKIATRIKKNTENLRLLELLIDRASELEAFLVSKGMEDEVDEIADSIWG